MIYSRQARQDGHWGKRHRLKRSATVLTLAAAVVACDSSSYAPDAPLEISDEVNERLSITNTQSKLDIRVAHPDSDVPIDADSASGVMSKFQVQPPIVLTLVSEIDPPVVNGGLLQASSVSFSVGNKAVVSYNMRGAPRLGAIDYFVTFKNAPPILRSQVVFDDSDVSAVSTDEKWVYAAEATEATGFPFPAVLERFRVRGERLTLEDNERVPLTSFAATSTLNANGRIYATSGDGGHVFAFAEVGLGLLGQFPLHDARWVEWDRDGDRIVVVQGTPGQISVFAEGEFPGGSMKLLNTFPFSGADVPESKSTVEIEGSKAFIAAGPEGVQIICLETGEIIGSVPRPDPSLLGLDPSVVVTNAVTIDDDLMFISNGEAGIYVARGPGPFAASGCSNQEITVLGKLRFDDLQSANHVAYRGEYLFVAAGLGGVKVVHVAVN